jgi:hypothetical protein
MPYDYEAIHARVCPDPSTLTLGQRTNREWPSAEDMIAFLVLLGSDEWQNNAEDTPYSANKSAYYQAMNNGLLTPPRNGWDGNGAPYTKHRLTEKGRAYLLHLKVITRKPKPDCRALMVIEQACTALVPAGHWERVSVFNQYHDAAYSVLIMENASTYAMGMPI